MLQVRHRTNDMSLPFEAWSAANDAERPTLAAPLGRAVLLDQRETTIVVPPPPRGPLRYRIATDHRARIRRMVVD